MATTINFGNNSSATMPVTPTNRKKADNSDTWKKVAIGGISAIAFGGAAYAATSMIKDNGGDAEDIEPKVDDNVAEGGSEAAVETPAAGAADFNPSLQMATSVNDDMTFAQAFAAARAEVHAGGVFEWHGNVYGTYYGNEWDALSPDQQSAFTAGTSHVAAERTQHHQAHDDTHMAENHIHEEQPQHNDNNSHENKVEENNDVAEVKVEHVDYDPTNDVSTAYVTVDNTEVIMADIDNDGVFDVLYVDENGDGVVSENEVYDITDENITVQGLGGYTEPSLEEYIDEDFLADNDIDIDSIEL